MVYTSDYPIFSVTVDVVAFTILDDELSVLLIKRRESPYRGRWALPGGFVGIAEDLAAAATRELTEETGVRVDALEQLATYGAPRRDPRGRTVSVAHLAVLREPGDLAAGTDAADAAWRPVADVGRLAFDHDRILGDAVERLAAKLEYTAMAAAFLSDTFTLADLRAVYETVWRQPLDPGNFHRKMRESTDFVVEVPGRQSGARGRPARRYRARKSGPTPLANPLVRSAQPG